jgi:hypothetical protein
MHSRHQPCDCNDTAQHSRAAQRKTTEQNSTTRTVIAPSPHAPHGRASSGQGRRSQAGSAILQ